MSAAYVGILVVLAIMVVWYCRRERFDAAPVQPTSVDGSLPVERALAQKIEPAAPPDAVFIATGNVDPTPMADYYLSGAELAWLDPNFQTTITRSFLNPENADDAEFMRTRSCRGAAKSGIGSYKPMRSLECHEPSQEIQRGTVVVPNQVTREDERGYLYREQTYDLWEPVR